MAWRGLLVALGVAAGAFGALTLVALEGAEVVRLRTTSPDGSLRTTRTWVADADGATWIEAANPARPFLLDVQARPDVLLDRGGRERRLHAVVVPGEAAHRTIRELLRAKYGWADVWIGLLADTSRSVAVRLDPAPVSAASARETGTPRSAP
jgi:hypothetical protein